MSEKNTGSNVHEIPPPAWVCPYGCGCVVRKASEAPYRGDNCPSCGGLIEEWAIEASASLRFTAGFSTEALEGTTLAELVGLANAILDNDGSRGEFDALTLGDVRERMETILSKLGMVSDG